MNTCTQTHTTLNNERTERGGWQQTMCLVWQICLYQRNTLNKHKYTHAFQCQSLNGMVLPDVALQVLDVLAHFIGRGQAPFAADDQREPASLHFHQQRQRTGLHQHPNRIEVGSGIVKRLSEKGGGDSAYMPRLYPMKASVGIEGTNCDEDTFSE